MDRIKLQLEKERRLRVSLEMELLKLQTGMSVSSDVDGKVSIMHHKVLSGDALIFQCHKVLSFLFNLEDKESGGYACCRRG